MSVLIKGMEMPKSCLNCRFHKSIYCTLTDICTNTAQGCPLVSVPPHGRLIDADALHYSRIRIAHPSGDIGGWNAVVMSAEINNAPTIIPADKEKET